MLVKRDLNDLIFQTDMLEKGKQIKPELRRKK